MVVMIGRAFVFMRIAWARVVVVVVVVVVMMVMTVLVHGGHDIAGIGREGATVHADEHAEHHDGLEEESHIDAPKIGDRACGSRHFGPAPFLDMIRQRGLVEACLLLVAMARCGRC